MRIGELAGELGVTTKALHYYDRWAAEAVDPSRVKKVGDV